MLNEVDEIGEQVARQIANGLIRAALWGVERINSINLPDKHGENVEIDATIHITKEGDDFVTPVSKRGQGRKVQAEAVVQDVNHMVKTALELNK